MEDPGFKYCKIPRGDIKKFEFFKRWYYRILDMSLAQYKWDLPPTCSGRMLELTLFYQGTALIFRDSKNLEWYTLPYALGGRLNMYDIPVQREAYANTGYREACTADNSVVVWGNMSRTPDCVAAVGYAEQLAELDMMICVNLEAVKTPYIIQGTKRQEKTLKTLFNKIAKNEKAIFIDNDIDPEKVSVLKTDSPVLYTSLQDEKDRLWNECLAYFGIMGGSIWKKERMVAAEVNLPAGQVVAQRAPRYMCRLEACEILNRRFGLGASVEFTGNLEGSIYGGLYDNAGGADAGVGGDGVLGGL